MGKRTPSSTNPEQDARELAAVDRVLESLSDDAETVVVAPLSDLGKAATAHLRERWPGLDTALRRRLTRAMLDDAESSVEHNYDRAMTIALDDPDADVRLLALEGLWECETDALLQLILNRVVTEPDGRVRATMAETLGRYAMLAELQDLNPADGARVRETLLRMVRHDVASEARHRALEAIGYFSGDSEVIDVLQRAYDVEDPEERVSALRAMGRQSDPRWVDIIGGEMASEEPEFRFEAVRAAGESGDQRYVPAAIDLTSDSDLEVRLAAIDSLGAIGGRMAVGILRTLIRDANPAVAEAAQEALDEALIMSASFLPQS